VNWPGFAAGLFFSAAVPPNDGSAALLYAALLHRRPPRPVEGLVDGLLGAAFGSFLLWGVAAMYKRIRGREGMGMGDVKMMAMVGAFLGVRGAFLTILLGTLLGTLVGVTIIVVLYFAGWHRRLAERASRRGLGSATALRWAIASQYQLPLGTFLGVAALLVVYFGRAIMHGWSQFFV
jgi:prepilin signal peptidase PulO-like enzyme (type II secretory pathway)